MPPNLGARAPVTWSDDLFLAEYKRVHMIKSRPTPSQGILCAKSFLNYYMFGSTPGNLQDTITGMLFSITTKDGNYLISDDFINDSSTYVVGAPGDVKKVTDMVWTSSCQGVAISVGTHAASSSGITGPDSQAPISWTNTLAIDWYNTCWEELEKPLENGKFPELTTKMLNLIGYILIVCTRSCAKEKTNVSIHIMTTTITRFSSFWGTIPNMTKVPPPCDETMDNLSVSLERLKPLSLRVLSYLVYSNSFGDSVLTSQRSPILRAGCLLSLSGIGLGCISWLFKSSELKKVSASYAREIVRDLLKVTPELADTSESLRITQGVQDEDRNKRVKRP